MTVTLNALNQGSLLRGPGRFISLEILEHLPYMGLKAKKLSLRLETR